MLGSNSKVWDLSPTLEVYDSGVGFIRSWVLQLQWLAYMVWFSQGYYQLLSEPFTSLRHKQVVGGDSVCPGQRASAQSAHMGAGAV